MTFLYTTIFFKLTLFLILPGLFWLYFFAGDKKIFKFGRAALIPVFVMGIFASVPAIAIEYFCVIITKLVENDLTIFISSFFIIGPLEEYLKSIAVDVAGYSKKEECNKRQILAWYFSAAIGFASIENVLYYFVFGSQVFFYRVLITTLAHVSCSGIIGLFIGKYLNEDTEISGFARGFFIAMLLHGAYDYTLNMYPISLWFWVPAFLLFGAYLESKLEYSEERQN